MLSALLLPMGPVIVINHSEWRCDTLILLRDSGDADPFLITAADDFHERAIELRDRLVRTRKEYSPRMGTISARFTVRTQDAL